MVLSLAMTFSRILAQIFITVPRNLCGMTSQLIWYPAAIRPKIKCPVQQKPGIQKKANEQLNFGSNPSHQLQASLYHGNGVDMKPSKHWTKIKNPVQQNPGLKTKKSEQASESIVMYHCFIFVTRVLFTVVVVQLQYVRHYFLIYCTSKHIYLITSLFLSSNDD